MKELINDPVIKLMGFLLAISSMWYDLKTDVAVMKATTEIRLDNLERQERRMAVMPSQKFALVPNQTEIEDDK